MNSLNIIPLSSLILMLIPVAIVLWLQFKWSLDYKEGIYAISRMLGQLLIIGYFLGYIFDIKHYWMVALIVTVMILVSSWIALRSIKTKNKYIFTYVFVSLLIGGLTTLLLVTQGVLGFDPWYNPRYFIPLAGMIFANNINSISLAAERYCDEYSRGLSKVDSRKKAFRTAMIPVTNSLFAVGLVSLPGMMTGQILSGVDPLIAVRYQIMVMAMLYGSEGISSATFLYFISNASAEIDVDLKK